MLKVEEAPTTASLRAALARNAVQDGPQPLGLEEMAGLHVAAFPFTAEIRPVGADGTPLTMGVLARIGPRFVYHIRYYRARKGWRGVLGIDFHVGLLKQELDVRRRLIGDVQSSTLSIDSAGAMLEATVALHALIADTAVREMQIIDSAIHRSAQRAAAAAEQAAQSVQSVQPVQG